MQIFVLVYSVSKGSAQIYQVRNKFDGSMSTTIPFKNQSQRDLFSDLGLVADLFLSI